MGKTLNHLNSGIWQHRHIDRQPVYVQGKNQLFRLNIDRNIDSVSMSEKGINMPAQQAHTFAGRAFLFEEKYTNKSRTASGKPAKERACPTQKKKFSKMPHARLKKI